MTGGLGSLGLCLTQTLLSRGADVVCMDLAANPTADAWGEFKTQPSDIRPILTCRDPLVAIAKKLSSRLTYVTCDVTSEESVEAAFSKAEAASRFPIRGLVTLAGISGRCPALEYDIGAFRKIIEINVVGTFLCARTAASIMQRQQVPGSIVMIASISGSNVNRVSHERITNRSS